MLYSFLLYSDVNQLYVHVCPLPLELRSHPIPLPLLQVITEHQAAFPVLYSLFPLALLHMVVHMSMLLSQFIPPSPSRPQPPVHVAIVYICMEAT